MLRRSTTSLFRATQAARMSVLVQQLEYSQVLTENDRPVNSFHDEFQKPMVNSDMEKKYGKYAKFSNPAFCKVDTSSEVVLNTYPDGPTQGRLENQYPDLKQWNSGFVDEAFFRKHILKPKAPAHLEDKARITDYMLSSTILGLTIMGLRYALAPLWWIGQPRMTLVAESNVEVELGQLEPKECKTVVWRGKPIYVYRRTEHQLKQLEETPLSALKHPETDVQRFPDNREMAVVIAICTHLGCIPSPNEGIYNGFFCPCHGSHYDASGRIRQGPAPLNLEVPPFKWIDEQTIFLGKM
jgi:ubiquinol-cytochrome c reductase iron-sulfur subunit